VTAPIVTPYPNTEFENRLHRYQRQRDLALRGYERNRMSLALAEALRNEIRAALEADGKPFDINVARHVYDLAIAAKDMCAAATAATGGVGDTVKLIADNNGPIESLGELEPDAPAVQAQASETFGARILRELMATLKPPQSLPVEDPKALVHALAEARRNGMTDVATELEIKLFGRELLSNKPIAHAIDVPHGSFDHGYADGKVDRPPEYGDENSDYHLGFLRGTEARFLEPVGGRAGAIEKKLVDDPPLCAACIKDPDPRGGSACFRCRKIRRAADRGSAHPFVTRVTDRFAGPPSETCEVCGTDPRNVMHENHEQALRDAHSSNGVTIV
jgi:hypothetical protein